jgi:hypothetical protein
MVEEMYEEESTKLERMRLAVAAKTQDIHMLKRKIDDVPTRAELVQYERRFVELYEQVATKLDETKRYYTKYNTLTDTHKFMTKEVSILNSISKQYPQVGHHQYWYCHVGLGRDCHKIQAVPPGWLSMALKVSVLLTRAIERLTCSVAIFECADTPKASQEILSHVTEFPNNRHPAQVSGNEASKQSLLMS